MKALALVVLASLFLAAVDTLKSPAASPYTHNAEGGKNDQ